MCMLQFLFENANHCLRQRIIRKKYTYSNIRKNYIGTRKMCIEFLIHLTSYVRKPFH